LSDKKTIEHKGKLCFEKSNLDISEKFMTPIEDTNETKDHDKPEEMNVAEYQSENPYLDLNNVKTI
jgi:hypothetical protein